MIDYEKEFEKTLKTLKEIIGEDQSLFELEIDDPYLILSKTIKPLEDQGFANSYGWALTLDYDEDLKDRVGIILERYTSAWRPKGWLDIGQTGKKVDLEVTVPYDHVEYIIDQFIDFSEQIRDAEEYFQEDQAYYQLLESLREYEDE